MLHDVPSQRTVALLISTVVVALAATSATASAAQTLCIAGTKVTAADADGTCKNKNATATTLAEQADLDAAQAKITALETKVAALETKLSKVSYAETGLNGKPTLQINGANLQIVDGSGNTGGTVNGLGNLFIGYNENPEERPQTGSHNLIIGPQHSFTSHGGLPGSRTPSPGRTPRLPAGSATRPAATSPR